MASRGPQDGPGGPQQDSQNAEIASFPEEETCIFSTCVIRVLAASKTAKKASRIAPRRPKRPPREPLDGLDAPKTAQGSNK
eukprot:1713343-Pyramimonas_sp.AAC.1